MAQLAWLDSPEPALWGFIHIVFFLIIAAPQVTNFVPFSGSLLYGNANPIQADDGSDRGPAQGLSRWAKASLPGTGTTRDSWTACPQTLIYIFRELARARRAGDATRG